MRISNAVSLVAAFCLFFAVCGAQPPPATPQSPPAAPPAPVAPPAATPSGVLQPSLNAVQQTLAALKLDKWKRGTVRDEAGKNIAAILRDIETSLPPLITAADSTPETLSKV